MRDYQDIATDLDPSEISDKPNIKQLTVKNQKTGKEAALGGGLIDFRYYESKGDIVFTSQNIFEITNKKEFARKFQISSKKINNIDRIFFDLEKNIDNGEISISNIYLNKIDTEHFSEEYYIIKNLQELKVFIRNFLT